MSGIPYNIERELGVFGETPKGTKELNLISWNDREPKYDIREWSPGRGMPFKGITVTRDQLFLLGDFIEKEKRRIANV